MANRTIAARLLYNTADVAVSAALVIFIIRNEFTILYILSKRRLGRRAVGNK